MCNASRFLVFLASMVMMVSGCQNAVLRKPQTQVGAGSPLAQTFTMEYKLSDIFDPETPQVKENNYQVILSSDGVRSYQQLDGLNERHGKRDVYIFDGKNQYAISGVYPNANSPRRAIIELKYARMGNPSLPSQLFGEKPFESLIKEGKAKQTGTEVSPLFGKLDVFAARFVDENGISYEGNFSLTQNPNRIIVSYVESGSVGVQTYRNEFTCTKIRTAGNVVMPEVCETRSYRSPELNKPWLVNRYEVINLSDTSLPPEKFAANLPPNSLVTDGATGNKWRVGTKGGLYFAPELSPRRQPWLGWIFFLGATVLIIYGAFGFVRWVKRRKASSQSSHIKSAP